MAEDPKRIFVALVGRLGRETQFHLDERHHHFRITNAVIVGVSVLLVVLAMINVYYIHVLYKDLDGIVINMESMHDHLKDIKGSMQSITNAMESYDQHMQHMDNINIHTASLARSLPRVSGSMSEMTGYVGTVEKEMGLLSQGMFNIDARMTHMIGGVTIMRENMRQISKPMGAMNPFMP